MFLSSINFGCVIKVKIYSIYAKYDITIFGFQEGAGDANDVWVVDVPGAEDGVRVQAVRSKLKLVHYHVKCALQSHDKKLPKWLVLHCIIMILSFCQIDLGK